MVRFRRFLLKLTLILGLILGAGIILREAVVETFARLVLSSRGLSGAEFEVVTVGRTEVVIENVSLGAGLLSVRRMQLNFDLAELVSGRLRDLRIEGLRFDPKSDRDGTLARLEALAAGGDSPLIELPKIHLVQAEIVLAAPLNGVVVIDGKLDLSGERLGADLDLDLDLGSTTAALTIKSEDLDEGGWIDINGGGSVELAGMALLGPLDGTATGGRASFSIDGKAQIPALGADWTKMLLAGSLALDGDVRLSEVTASVGQGVLSADIGWVVRSDNDGLQISLTRPAKLVAQEIAPEILAALHLTAVDDAAQVLSVGLSSSEPVISWAPESDGGVVKFTGDFSVALGDAVAEIRANAKAAHDADWRLTAPVQAEIQLNAAEMAFSGTGGAGRLDEIKWIAAGSYSPAGVIDLSGPIAITASAIGHPQFKADAANANGEIRVQRSSDGWSISAASGMLIAVDGVVVPGRLELAQPVQLTMGSLELSGGDAGARLEMLMSPNQMSGVLLGGDGQDTAFADAGGAISLSLGLRETVDGKIQLEGAQFSLPGEAISLNDVSGSVLLGGSAGLANFILSGEVHDTGRAARFSTVKFDLAGNGSGETVSVSGAIETGGQAVRLPIDGSVDLAGMTGKIKLGPTRIEFRKGGLQPTALSPGLAALRDTKGDVRVSAEINLDGKGAVRTAMSLTLENLSARMGDVDVVGLSGMVKLNRLSPLASAGPQSLTARRIIAGVPVENPRIKFTILPRRRGVSVRLHEFTGEISGGGIVIEDAQWDSVAKSNSFDVQIQNVEIERLLRDWQVEGISGTGSLSGMIPVRIGPTGVAVVGGQLDSAGAGAIRVDWGAARETMINAGEQVALTVNALEDFRYDTLSIGIDQPEDGKLTLAVGLEGSNPAVLDGYPFRFNINLSGQLAPILEAVREGRRIGTELLGGGLGLP